MKPNSDGKAFLEKLLRWSNLLATATLVAGIILYAKIESRINAGEQKARLTENLNEASQLSTLLRQINTGETNLACDFLKSKLASDLESVDSLKKADDTQGKQFAEIVLKSIAREEKAHPEYYLLASGRLSKAPQNGHSEVSLVTQR